MIIIKEVINEAVDQMLYNLVIEMVIIELSIVVDIIVINSLVVLFILIYGNCHSVHSKMSRFYTVDGFHHLLLV